MNLCPELRRLQAEHARWLQELERRAEGEGVAARLLTLWKTEIQPHCRREEEVLIPELARQVPEADAVIMMSLADHVGLRRLARELEHAAGSDAAAVAARLLTRLGEHLAFEERTLFTAAQEQLGTDRLAALGAELRGDEAGRTADRPRAVNDAGPREPLEGRRRPLARRPHDGGPR